MKLSIFLLVFILSTTFLFIETAYGWPVAQFEEHRKRMNYKLTDAVSRLETADDQIWLDYLHFREMTNRDINVLVEKLNEVIGEVNQIKIRRKCD